VGPGVQVGSRPAKATQFATAGTADHRDPEQQAQLLVTGEPGPETSRTRAERLRQPVTLSLSNPTGDDQFGALPTYTRGQL
jgi:hypothetical protein